jgi:hypothetical protein
MGYVIVGLVAALSAALGTPPEAASGPLDPVTQRSLATYARIEQPVDKDRLRASR